MSPEHSASPGPGAPYRQVSCEACGEASAAEICPLCKRPICAGCHHIRAELGRKTLEGILGAVTRQDSRSEKKLAAREMLKSVATGVGAGLGLPLILMPFKGLQVLMASLALVPIFTFKELVGWYRSRSQEREARFMEPRDLEPEVAALAPCSESCWGATGLGPDLIHSSAALYYGIYCKECMPDQLKYLEEAIAASGMMADAPAGQPGRSPGHPALRSARICAEALGLELNGRARRPSPTF